MMYVGNETAFACLSGAHRRVVRGRLVRGGLMLSAAVAACLAAPAWADTVTTDDVCVTGVTCITEKKTSVYKTSASNNIYIFNDSTNGYGKIIVDKSDIALATLDSNNYFYSNGYLSDTDHSNSVGIKVDLSSSRSASGLSFLNYADDTVKNAAIYLDASSYTYLSGNGSNKTGIWLNGSGTLTGDIVSYNGALMSLKGDGSYGLLLDSTATLAGNIDWGGSLSVYQHTAKNTDYTGIFGMYIAGAVTGNVGIASGGTVFASGSGSQGLFLTGASGVAGNVTISGTLETEGYDYYSSSSSSSYYYGTSTKKITYPEGGTALTINSNIVKGVEITGLNYTDDSSSSTGSVTTYGTGTAVLISPVVTVGTTTYTKTSPLVIGLFQSYDSDTAAYSYEQYDPGFGFYNRGTVSISPTNLNRSVEAAVKVYGTSALPTYINGGIFNSGSMGASASTDDSANTVSATALLISGNVYVGGYYDTATGTYYQDSISCSGKTCTYTSGIPSTILGTDGTALTKLADDAASLVNSGETSSGKIAASISGKGGGVATAISISAASRVTSLINSGTISATATTTSTNLSKALEAYGIYDLSGTLTYIRNSGTISAAATTLDSDAQIARAIDLSVAYTAIDADTTLTAAQKLAKKQALDSYDGVTIVSAATTNGAAKITGDIVFGEGSNQQIYVSGASSSYSSTITGDIHFGSCGSTSCTGNDLLSIGAFGYVSGAVTADSGVSLYVANNGMLALSNDQDSGALLAQNLTVKDGGYFSIGIKQDSGLTTSGIIQASGTVLIEKGANLGLSFDSYIGSNDYVLIRSTSGNMTVVDIATYSHNISTPIIADGSMPFLFKSADITTKYYDASGALISSCTGQGTCSTAYSKADIVLSVETKTASELGLTGYAKQIFGYANTAVATDDTLGAAMVNGIHANVDDLTATGASTEAQSAYDSFAPNVTGGTRAIAISITDQASGVVGARQRALRLYGKADGELTLWAQEFVQQIKNPGTGAVQQDDSREKNGFKDHGFGVVLGMDAGSADKGWYGGALTFYNGDVNEIGRTSHENQLWFVATGYTTWRGKGLFLDTKVDIGYAHIKGLRDIYLLTGTGSSQSVFVRYAQNSHSAAMVSGGATGGAYFNYGSFTFAPQLSLDALFLRENGYTEYNPYGASADADGFSLKVKSQYARSLRSFLGTTVRYDYDFDGYFLQPEIRMGYRYDFVAGVPRVKAAFKDINADLSGNQHGDWFTLTGPGAAQGGVVLGSSLGFTSDAWSLNLNYDYVRGGNNNIVQALTLNLVGRI